MYMSYHGVFHTHCRGSTYLRNVSGFSQSNYTGLLPTTSPHWSRGGVGVSRSREGCLTSGADVDGRVCTRGTDDSYYKSPNSRAIYYGTLTSTGSRSH